MIEIPLTQGQVALIDDADMPLVSPYKWFAKRDGNSFYASACVRGGGKKGPKIYMHRLILGLTDPTIQVDHRDHNGLNNQRNNIRACNRHQNQRNAIKARHGTTSQYRGVHFHRRTGKWNANINGPKGCIYLGQFCTEREAAFAYDAAAKVRFGEFANLNFPALVSREDEHSAALASLSGERRTK